MVSPAIDQLSVFITPWMKPTSIQRATSSACRVNDRLQQREIGPLGTGDVGVMPGDDVVGERLHPGVVAARGEELEGADADVARRHPGQHGAGQHGFAQHAARR